MHCQGPKPHRLAGGEGGIEAVEDSHLVSALVVSVQIQGDGRAVSLAKLTTPAWSRPGLQRRGHNLSGHQITCFKQQAELVESHNNVLSLQILVLSR